MKYLYMLCFIPLVCCVGETNEMSYSTYEFEIGRIDKSIDTINEVIQDESGITYCYSINKCEKYQMLDDGNLMHISIKNDTVVLLYDEKADYLINGEHFLVERYYLATASFDGGMEYYWSNDFGIVLIKSKTWSGFKMLEQKGNDKLSTLIQVIEHDNIFLTDDKEELDNQIDIEIDSLINKDLGELL